MLDKTSDIELKQANGEEVVDRISIFLRFGLRPLFFVLQTERMEVI